MRSNEPMMPPMSTAPRTISIGAADPTASLSASSVTAAAEVPAISRVTSPSPSVTTLRVRSGRRCPRSTPSDRADQHRDDVHGRTDSGQHPTSFNV